MEKVRFEAFNVEELRVLRRACYEAGAAFGDPGHTAADRPRPFRAPPRPFPAVLPVAAGRRPPPSFSARRGSRRPGRPARPISRRLRRKLSRSQSRRKSARCSGWTFWKGQKLHSPPKAPTGPRSRPSRQSLPASCMCAAKNAARNAASAQRHRFPRVIAGSAAGKRSSKICARSRSGASAAAPTGTTRISRTPHLICRA